MVYSPALSTRFASTYGSGAYDTSTYNGDTTTSTGATTGTGAAGGNGSLLTNTGFDILLAASFACLIIFAALLIRFWRRPRQLAAVSVEVASQDSSRPSVGY